MKVKVLIIITLHFVMLSYAQQSDKFAMKKMQVDMEDVSITTIVK